MVGDVNYSKPKSISRTYKCPVCKYEWVHDIATGENYRDSPREYNPKEKKGIAA
jgi:hypothetical protein